MLFAEFGNILKEKREALGISSNQVAQSLRIPHNSILAIESGNIKSLPEGIYVISFLRAYALKVGFSAEEIKEYLSNIEDINVNISPPKTLEFQSAERGTGGSTNKIGFRVLLQLLVIGIIGISLYFLFIQVKDLDFISDIFGKDKVEVVENFEDSADSKPNELKKSPNTEKSLNSNIETKEDTEPKQVVWAEESENSSEAKETSLSSQKDEIDEVKVVQKISEELPTDAQVKIEEEIKSEQQELSQKEVFEKQPIKELLPKEEQKSKETKEFDIKALIAKYPSAQKIDWNSITKVQKGLNQVVIYATEDCWIQAINDGKKSTFTLKANKQRVMEYKDAMELHFGNASAITLFANHKPIKVGDSSKLRIVTLD